jgi:hypothetical protein
MQYLFRVFAFAVFAFASSSACADEKPQQAAKPATPAKQEMQIEKVTVIVLIKSTIMALQHANQTGNYSILRDMGSPIFRERYDQAALTAAFANLRSRQINLNPVLFLAPSLSKAPEMTSGSELHLVGNFPTQPLQIQYDMRFLYLDGAWRLNGFAVDAVTVQALAGQYSAPTQSATAAPIQPAATSSQKASSPSAKSDKKRIEAGK